MEPPLQPWPTGVVDRLEPMVARVLAPNPSLFTFTGTQSYIIGGHDGVAVVDPGPADPRHLDALLTALNNRPLLAICCTHTHRDHSPAAILLARLCNAPIIGCAPLTLDDDGPRADAAFDPDYRPDHILSDGEGIEGTDWTLRAISTPGHTSNHLCFALETPAHSGPVHLGMEKSSAPALFTGDHVMNWSTTVVAPPDGDMAAYMLSLEKLQHRHDRIYYPAHGPAIARPQQFLRGLIGHRRQREAQILKLILRRVDNVPAMLPHMYKGVTKALWPAAAQSVLAHLVDLEARARVIRDGDRWALPGDEPTGVER